MRASGRAAVLFCTTVLGACERPAAPVAEPPATTQATAAPATKPFKRTPAQFVLSQSQAADRRIEFPPAKLVLTEKDDGVRLSFFSDDPQTTVQDRAYAGNSFYFRAEFDCALADLPGREQSYRAASEGERPEGNDAPISLFGDKQELQPIDAAIRIEKEDDQLVVYLAGRFNVFDVGKPETPVTVVMLRARVAPEVITKK